MKVVGYQGTRKKILPLGWGSWERRPNATKLLGEWP
jgi:hypothetical protein